jgi:HSP20 family protein
MKITRWSPFSLFNDDFDGFFGDRMPATLNSGAFQPRTDIYEKEGNIYVEMAVPGGIKKDNISVSVNENNQLVITGESERKTEVDDKNFYKKEIRRGSFHQAFALPEKIDAQAIEATCKDGILTVQIPRLSLSDKNVVHIDVKHEE